MTKFIEALEIQLAYPRVKKALIPPPKLFNEPITLSQDFVTIGHVDRYTLSLNWSVPIYLNPPVFDDELQEARKEAMSCLKGLVYMDIYRILAEIKFLIKNYENEKAGEMLQQLMKDMMN